MWVTTKEKIYKVNPNKEWPNEDDLVKNYDQFEKEELAKKDQKLIDYKLQLIKENGREFKRTKEYAQKMEKHKHDLFREAHDAINKRLAEKYNFNYEEENVNQSKTLSEVLEKQKDNKEITLFKFIDDTDLYDLHNKFMEETEELSESEAKYKDCTIGASCGFTCIDAREQCEVDNPTDIQAQTTGTMKDLMNTYDDEEPESTIGAQIEEDQLETARSNQDLYPFEGQYTDKDGNKIDIFGQVSFDSSANKDEIDDAGLGGLDEAYTDLFNENGVWEIALSGERTPEIDNQINEDLTNNVPDTSLVKIDGDSFVYSDGELQTPEDYKVNMGFDDDISEAPATDTAPKNTIGQTVNIDGKDFNVTRNNFAKGQPETMTIDELRKASNAIQADGTNEIPGRVDRFKDEWLPNNNSFDATEVYVDKNGNMTIIDGRHRSEALSRSGVKDIPVIVEREN